MLRSLHISKTGMDASQFRLDVITNNLANVNTTGFKRSRGVFEDLMYQVIRQPGAQSSATTQLPVGLMVGTGSAAVATERMHTQGNLQNTENSFDVAIDGNGFFQVEMPDGSTAYTRDGSFKRSNTGELVTSSGYRVVPGITIPVDTKSMVISANGDVSLTNSAGATTVVGSITTANFVNPAGLESIGGNLYRETPASGAADVGAPNDPAGGRGALKQGFLENSNVNITQELVDMIQAQRAFEINSRGIKTSDEMLQRLSQL